MNHAIDDVLNGAAKWRLWVSLAWEEFAARYYKTIFGPIWLSVSFLAFVFVKIFVFGALNPGDPAYFIAFLTIGYMIWTYLATAINGSSQSLIAARNWILGIKTPVSIFVFQNLVEALLNFVFVATAGLIVAYLYQPFDLGDLQLAFVGLVLLVACLFWVQLSLAVMCVFFRDMIQLVQTVMRIAFFVTPIIWLPETLGDRAWFVNLNPFTHLIGVIRAPLLGEDMPMLSVAVVVGIGMFAMIYSLTLLTFTKKHIPAYV